MKIQNCPYCNGKIEMWDDPKELCDYLTKDSVQKDHKGRPMTYWGGKESAAQQTPPTSPQTDVAHDLTRSPATLAGNNRTEEDYASSSSRVAQSTTPAGLTDAEIDDRFDYLASRDIFLPDFALRYVRELRALAKIGLAARDAEPVRWLKRGKDCYFISPTKMDEDSVPLIPKPEVK